MRAQTRAFAGLAAFTGTGFNISDDRGLPEQARGSLVTAETFRLIGQAPLVGRDFAPADDRKGAEMVVILGYSIWKNRYGSDAGVIGRPIRVNGQPATIIGVMPDGDEVPDGGRYVGALHSNRRAGEARQPPAQRVRPAEARVLARAGADGDEHHRRPARGPISRHEQGVHAHRGRDLQRSVQRRSDQGRVPVDDGRGRVRPPDRVRERRQPAAVALGAPLARDCRPHRARRHTLAGDPAAARREHRPRLHRRRARPAARARRRPPLRRRGAGRRQALLDRLHDGLRRLRVPRRHLRADRHPLRPRAGAAGVEDERQRGPEGRRPRHERRTARALVQLDDGRRGAGADNRAARRRRLDDSELPEALHGRHRHRPSPPDEHADPARHEIQDAGAAPRILRPAHPQADRDCGGRVRRAHHERAAVRCGAPRVRDRGTSGTQGRRGSAAGDVGHRESRLLCDRRRASPPRARLLRDRRTGRRRKRRHQRAPGVAVLPRRGSDWPPPSLRLARGAPGRPAAADLVDGRRRQPRRSVTRILRIPRRAQSCICHTARIRQAARRSWSAAISSPAR